MSSEIAREIRAIPSGGWPLALALGISAGLAAALRKNTVVDRLISGIAMSGISIPVFVVAPVLVLVFAVYLQWLPASWSGGNGVSRLVLPVTALALPQIAFIARLVRGNMISAESSGALPHAVKPMAMPQTAAATFKYFVISMNLVRFESGRHSNALLASCHCPVRTFRILNGGRSCCLLFAGGLVLVNE